MKKYTFLALAHNRPGVLNKITMIVRRKMYNIDTLTASPTRKPGISAITIVINSENAADANQVRSQLARIVEITSIEQLISKNSVQEELMLVKTTPKSQKHLAQLMGGFFSRVVYKSDAQVIIEAVGTKKELDSLLKKLPNNEIIEIARTGITSMKIL